MAAGIAVAAGMAVGGSGRFSLTQPSPAGRGLRTGIEYALGFRAAMRNFVDWFHPRPQCPVALRRPQLMIDN